jgi:hypothetical protein
LSSVTAPEFTPGHPRTRPTSGGPDRPRAFPDTVIMLPLRAPAPLEATPAAAPRPRYRRVRECCPPTIRARRSCTGLATAAPLGRPRRRPSGRHLGSTPARSPSQHGLASRPERSRGRTKSAPCDHRQQRRSGCCPGSTPPHAPWQNDRSVRPTLYHRPTIGARKPVASSSRGSASSTTSIDPVVGIQTAFIAGAGAGMLALRDWVGPEPRFRSLPGGSADRPQRGVPAAVRPSTRCRSRAAYAQRAIAPDRGAGVARRRSRRRVGPHRYRYLWRQGEVPSDSSCQSLTQRQLGPHMWRRIDGKIIYVASNAEKWTAQVGFVELTIRRRA